MFTRNLRFVFVFVLLIFVFAQPIRADAEKEPENDKPAPPEKPDTPPEKPESPPGLPPSLPGQPKINVADIEKAARKLDAVVKETIQETAKHVQAVKDAVQEKLPPPSDSPGADDGKSEGDDGPKRRVIVLRLNRDGISGGVHTQGSDVSDKILKDLSDMWKKLIPDFTKF